MGAWGCVAAVTALIAAGCGSGAVHRTSSSATTARAAAHPSSGSSTTTTSTAPTTTSTTATTPRLPGTGRPTVTIGDKNYDEQFVLGQLYLQALKAQGFSVNITDNIGPPSVVRQRLKTGALGMYPEYLNTFDQTLAHDRRTFTSRAAALEAARRWARRHGLSLLPATPFSDTYALAVTDAFAMRHRLSSIGDLSRAAGGLAIGGAMEFKTYRIGLPGLARAYGVIPTAFTPLAVGAQYSDLAAGTVQAAYVNTTDGQLIGGDYRALRDPRHLFGFGNVIPVVSRAVLAMEGPAFAATIERVDRTLTLPAMRALNAAVSIAHEAPTTVATTFLQTHGLLQPLRRRG